MGEKLSIDEIKAACASNDHHQKMIYGPTVHTQERGTNTSPTLESDHSITTESDEITEMAVPDGSTTRSPSPVDANSQTLDADKASDSNLDQMSEEKEVQGDSKPKPELESNMKASVETADIGIQMEESIHTYNVRIRFAFV